MARGVTQRTKAVLAAGRLLKLDLRSLLPDDEIEHVIEGALERWPRASDADLAGVVAYYGAMDAWPEDLADTIPYVTPPPPFSKARCVCVEYIALPQAHREAMAKTFAKKLSRVAKHEESDVSLYECTECQRTWQDRYAGALLFPVPRLSKEEWLAEPFADVFAWALYEAMRLRFMADNPPAESGEPCKTAGCARLRIPSSVFCAEHHWSSGSAGGPERPEGRPLPSP